MATATTKSAPMQHANGSAEMIEAIETNVNDAQEAAAKAGDTLAVWLRKLPLASLGLVAVIGDETKVFANKLFMNKLVERGELLQKDAEQRMKDVQARFR
jgi:hypothetical protein